MDHDLWIEAYKKLRESGARAIVVWRVEDVKALAPQLSDEEALAWLDSNEEYITDLMTQRGWDAIEELLASDNIEATGEPGDVW